MYAFSELYYFSYNIRYGRVSATDDEVESAAKVAEIHEKIMTFPNGNNVAMLS